MYQFDFNVVPDLAVKLAQVLTDQDDVIAKLAVLGEEIAESQTVFTAVSPTVELDGRFVNHDKGLIFGISWMVHGSELVQVIYGDLFVFHVEITAVSMLFREVVYLDWEVGNHLFSGL